MIRRPPSATRNYILVPSTTLFRSCYCGTAGAYLDQDVWIDNFVRSACGDGNYLLGISAPSTGRFDPALVDKLARANLWLERHGASLFETRGGPFKRTSGYGATCKGKRSDEHTSELQSIMRTSYAVHCLKQKQYIHTQ